MRSKGKNRSDSLAQCLGLLYSTNLLSSLLYSLAPRGNSLPSHFLQTTVSLITNNFLKSNQKGLSHNICLPLFAWRITNKVCVSGDMQALGQPGKELEEASRCTSYIILIFAPNGFSYFLYSIILSGWLKYLAFLTISLLLWHWTVVILLFDCFFVDDPSHSWKRKWGGGSFLKV